MERKKLESLKSLSDNSLFKDSRKDNNIPAYNDNEIIKKMEKTERERMRVIEAENIEKKRLEKIEYKKSLNKFSEINDSLLLIMGLSLVGIIASLMFLKFNYVIYCAISCYLAYFVGKRLKPIEDENNILQTLLWNLSESINDFFEYKIKFDMKADYIDDVAKYSTIFAIISGLFNSNTIVYPLSLLILLLSFIVAFACKDVETILEKKGLILGALIGGFLVKGCIHSLIRGVLVLDLFNLALAIGFISLFHLLEYVDLTEPLDD